MIFARDVRKEEGGIIATPPEEGGNDPLGRINVLSFLITFVVL